MNEAELLFTHVLACDRASLYTHKDALMGPEASLRIACALKRRVCDEPIQYIIGQTEFMGLEFKVGPAVLIPRPETELLVEKAVSLACSLRLNDGHKPKILDVGTGSGCIAISLAKFLPQAQIDATDISKEALKIARENASLHNVAIDFVHSDLFPCGLSRPAYDMIISNPPYIPSAEIENLQPEVRQEPRVALDGGRDGLDFYRAIIAGAASLMKEDGVLVMEMGFKQSEVIARIVQNTRGCIIQEVVKDYSGIERIIVIRYKTRKQNAFLE